jgi:UDPglucose 6-dehydrogenase
VGTDSRIGKRFLFPGIGYGGSCFPKDVQALAKSASDVKYDFRILNAVMDVNEDQKTRLIERIKTHFKGNLKGKTIAFWGLSFKPHTDDIREAPSLYNIEALLSEGVTIRAHDPEAIENVKRIVGDKIGYFDTPYDAAEGADAIFIATEWPEFRTPDFEKLSGLLKSKVIFDGRNLYDLSNMKELGYTYFSIGREVING